MAAKWNRQNNKYEDPSPSKCECLERNCAMWDGNSHICGFLASPITQKLAVQN